MRSAKEIWSILTNSGAITQKVQGGGHPKIGGAQQLMLGNNPMKFLGSSMNGY